MLIISFSFFFFFNDTATTEIYTLSLHDALPISGARVLDLGAAPGGWCQIAAREVGPKGFVLGVDLEPKPLGRSEEHTSELQSRPHLVCRLLLEKKKNIQLCLVSDERTRTDSGIH